MKLPLFLFVTFFITTQVFSQEGWDYQIINSSNNQYGAICAIDENLVNLILDDGIFLKSTDGGENWTEYDTGVSEYFFDMAFYNNDIGFAVGANGTIIKTINGGEEWTLLASGTSNDLFSISMPSLDIIWMVGDNGTVLNSTNQGDTWAINNTISNEKLNSISFRDANIGFIAGNNGTLFHTLNGGVLWEESNITTNNDLFSISTTDDSSFLLAGYVDQYYAYEGYTGFKTNDNVNWEEFYIPIETIGPSKLFFYDNNLGFSVTATCLLCDCCFLDIDKTSNSGDNWESSCNIETTDTNLLTLFYQDIDFATNEIGYVFSGSLLLKTIDGGTSTEIILNVNDFTHNNNRFTLYPNPSNQTNFYIDFNNLNINNLSVEILDINGKRIFSENKLHNDMNFDISNFSEGIYFVELIKNGTIIDNQKLIVKK
jgi:photosystem II stability/assembly factor-like uncharacterized protein